MGSFLCLVPSSAARLQIGSESKTLIDCCHGLMKASISLNNRHKSFSAHVCSARAAPARRRSHTVSATGKTADSLLIVPVFKGSSVLLPVSHGILRAFEPRYVSMFQKFVDKTSAEDRIFLHVIGPLHAPPAMMSDSPFPDIPAIGCVAIVEDIDEQKDGSLVVKYKGYRRMQIHHIEKAAEGAECPDMVAGTWYDDKEVICSTDVAALNSLERDIACLVSEIERKTHQLDPFAKKALPHEISFYAPPGQNYEKATSYDALKASGHKAASAIDMWRRHGTVYKTSREMHPKKEYSDPYTKLAEQLGKQRRQELFSFAVAQLLQMGIPEQAALLLSQDTPGRLAFVAAAAIPYLNQLRGQVAIKNALGE